MVMPPSEPRAGDERRGSTRRSRRTSSTRRADGEGPQDPVGEDLPRAGRLQRGEVEREEPPDAVGEEAVDRAAARSSPVVSSRRAASAPASRRPVGARRHATVQVSRPRSRSARSSSVAGPPAVSIGGLDLGAHQVVVGRPRRPGGRCPSARASSRGCPAARAGRPATGPSSAGRARRRHRTRPLAASASAMNFDACRTPCAPGPCRSPSAPTVTGSPATRRTMRASCWLRSLSTSKAPSLKIGQFW